MFTTCLVLGCLRKVQSLSPILADARCTQHIMLMGKNTPGYFLKQMCSAPHFSSSYLTRLCTQRFPISFSHVTLLLHLFLGRSTSSCVVVFFFILVYPCVVLWSFALTTLRTCIGLCSTVDVELSLFSPWFLFLLLFWFVKITYAMLCYFH